MRNLLKGRIVYIPIRRPSSRKSEVESLSSATCAKALSLPVSYIIYIRHPVLAAAGRPAGGVPKNWGQALPQALNVMFWDWCCIKDSLFFLGPAPNPVQKKTVESVDA